MDKIVIKSFAFLGLVLAVVMSVMLFQQGGYLQSRVFGQMTEITPTAGPIILDADGVDSYTKQEAYCFDVKEEYLQQCDLASEDEQYNCDLGEVEKLFRECLGEVIQ